MRARLAALLERRVVGLTAEEMGLTLAEGKNLLGELARLILQTQMEEFTTCARVCRDCLKLRRLRDHQPAAGFPRVTQPS
jgi:hypothetical protein